ncbi:MAG: 1-deoxy-D-xylulose-5-phosphate synthase, partial [Oscillospiraceae bacterium]|nr:1-deoxy-D-xylulose-5-phosphate synthase [Oscillospiraceae bacterium]
KIIKKSKLGIAVDNGIHAVKNAFKNAFLPSSFFEDMGFTYLGPADGHDLKYIIYLLELARDLKRPVVIHLTTKKGKGYELSEANPQDYHGVGKFDVEKGIEENSQKKTFSSVFGRELVSMAQNNDKICAITAAMTSGVGLLEFAEKFPERFFDVAIAEEHAVAMAAGLASQGMVPVCAIYSTFLQRAYDMLIHDVAISGQHIVFAVDRAGFVGEDGETHHGVFDVSFLSSIPNFEILAPANYDELKTMLEYSVKAQGPVAIRYGRGSEGEYTSNSFDKNAPSAVLISGKDVTVVTYGMLINNAKKAVEFVGDSGVSCELIKLNSLKPLDTDTIIESVRKTGKLVVVEDVVENGSVSQMISDVICRNGMTCKVKALNSGDSFTTHGNTAELQKLHKIDVDGISDAIMEAHKSE